MVVLFWKKTDQTLAQSVLLLNRVLRFPLVLDVFSGVGVCNGTMVMVFGWPHTKGACSAGNTDEITDDRAAVTTQSTKHSTDSGVGV